MRSANTIAKDYVAFGITRLAQRILLLNTDKFVFGALCWENWMGQFTNKHVVELQNENRYVYTQNHCNTRFQQILR